MEASDSMPEAFEMSSVRDALAADSATEGPVSDLMIDHPVHLSRASQASLLQWLNVANRNAGRRTTSTLNSELAGSPDRLSSLVGSKASAADVFHIPGFGPTRKLNANSDVLDLNAGFSCSPSKKLRRRHTLHTTLAFCE